MSIYLNNKLNELDKFFDGKKQSEILIIFCLPPLLVFFLSIQYLMPFASKVVNKSKTEKQEIQAKIESDKDFVAEGQAGSQTQIMLLERQLAQQNEELARAKAQNNYIKEKFSSLEGLIFTQQNWTMLVDSLNNYSASNKLQMIKMQNGFFDLNGTKLVKVMQIQLEVGGDFKNFLRFIDDIEKSKSIVEVDSVNIVDENKTLLMSLGLTVWGVGL